jgi:hypothetical protein
VRALAGSQIEPMHKARARIGGPRRGPRPWPAAASPWRLPLARFPRWGVPCPDHRVRMTSRSVVQSLSLGPPKFYYQNQPLLNRPYAAQVNFINRALQIGIGGHTKGKNVQKRVGNPVQYQLRQTRRSQRSGFVSDSGGSRSIRITMAAVSGKRDGIRCRLQTRTQCPRVRLFPRERAA